MHRRPEDVAEHDVNDDDQTKLPAGETKKKKKRQSAFKLLDLEYFSDDIDSRDVSEEEDNETFSRQGAFRRKKSSAMTRNWSDLEMLKRHMESGLENSSIQPLLSGERESLEARLKRKWNKLAGNRQQKVVLVPVQEYPTGLRSKVNPRNEDNGIGLRSKGSLSTDNKHDDIRTGLRSKSSVQTDYLGIGLRSKSSFPAEPHAGGVKSRSVPQFVEFSVGLRSKAILNVDETAVGMRSKTVSPADERTTKASGPFKGLRKKGSKKWTLFPNDVVSVKDVKTCEDDLRKNCDACGTSLDTVIGDCPHVQYCVSCKDAIPQIKRVASFGFFRSNQNTPNNLVTWVDGEVQQSLIKITNDVSSRSIPTTETATKCTLPSLSSSPKQIKQQPLKVLLSTFDESQDNGHQTNCANFEQIPEASPKVGYLNGRRKSDDHHFEPDLSGEKIQSTDKGLSGDFINKDDELRKKDYCVGNGGIGDIGDGDTAYNEFQSLPDRRSSTDTTIDIESDGVCPNSACTQSECTCDKCNNARNWPGYSEQDNDASNHQDVLVELDNVNVIEIAAPRKKKVCLQPIESCNLTSSTSISETPKQHNPHVSALTFASSPNIGEGGQHSKAIFSSIDTVNSPSSPSAYPSGGGRYLKRPSVNGVASRKYAVTTTRRRRPNEKKASNVLSIIVTVFVITWTPFFTMNIVSVICPSCTMSMMMSHAAASFVWFGFMSSLANPIICTMFSTSFRTVFYKILTCKYPCGGRASRRARARGGHTSGCCGMRGKVCLPEERLYKKRVPISNA